MRNGFWILPLAAAALIGCGGNGDDGNGGGNATGGAGGTGGTTTSSTTGTGGATVGGGGTADPCEGITPERTVITPEELLSMLDAKDFSLINVHIPYEGEIPGTDAHIPYNDVDAIEEYLGQDKGANVVLYCRTGPMSEIAGDALVERGYCRIQDMAAGSYQWEQLGYPYDP